MICCCSFVSCHRCDHLCGAPSALTLVCCSAKQCSDFGDISYAIKDKIIPPTSIVELGQVIQNPKNFPFSNQFERKDKITVADLTGVAVQDVAIASLVFDALVKKTSKVICIYVCTVLPVSS